MRVLVACEFSGRVRDAFLKVGCDAWSCDLLPTEVKGPHIQDDVLNHLDEGWDLMIAHPPCTHLAVSGAKHFHKKAKRQRKALEFVLQLLNAPIHRICLENPVSVISTRICKPTQIIQPWMFGHKSSKRTCLWLKRLPKLEPTELVFKGSYDVTRSGKRIPSWYNIGPSPDRWKVRSSTLKGVASAMALQWGDLEVKNYGPRMREAIRSKHVIREVVK